MKIAIIGAGNVGGTLAKGWAKTGHSIIVSARDSGAYEVKNLVDSHQNISGNNIIGAVKESDVILVSVPVAAIIEVANQIGQVMDKIIIDATNSVFSRPGTYNNCFDALKEITKCKEIVKCFNSTGFENLADPHIGNTTLDMFMAGNGNKAKQIARQLSLDIGFENCYDFGGDDKVELLEQFALCWINLAMIQKQGREIAFKLLRR